MSQLRILTGRDVQSHAHPASSAELLFALDEPALAEQLILDRAAELDGGNYILLTSLAKTAKANGRYWRQPSSSGALLDAILAPAYAKVYGHGAQYLDELLAMAAEIVDCRGHRTHETYEQVLRVAHGRKTRF